MRPYDYAQRKGVAELNWEDCAKLSRQLASELAAQEISTVIGIARAGLIPATTVALAMHWEFFPVRVTRRVNDKVVRDHPVWLTDVPISVAGQRVAVIDEIADSGETLALVAARVRERGASQVVTACLVSHTWADPVPDLCALVSDALIIFPWDKNVLVDGRWDLHPELSAALRAQEIQSKTKST
jgi:hypoxanthine phosphoribosyltransferase